jgi:hypothetical protein
VLGVSLYFECLMHVQCMYTMYFVIIKAFLGRSVARSSSFLTQSGAANTYLIPIIKQGIIRCINLCQLFLIRHALRSLFKVPDTWSITRGGSVNAIVHNILSRPFNLQLIIIRFIPPDWINRIDDFSVAIWPKSSEFLFLIKSTILIPSSCPLYNIAR